MSGRFPFPAHLRMVLFPKVQVGRTTSPYISTIPGMRPLGSWEGQGEERVHPVAWSSTIASRLPSPGPGVPGGSCRALPQILIQGPAWGGDGRRPNALYTEVFYCWEGVFLPQFVNIHVLHKCLILSEQSCAVVSFAGGLGTGRQWGLDRVKP